jgi:phosphate transport system permease protein
MSANSLLPSPENKPDQEFNVRLQRRHRAGRIWLLVFQASTLVGIIALLALLYNIANGAFGLVAIEYRLDPDELTIEGIAVEEMDKEMLVIVLQNNISAGLFRQIEREKPIAERSQDEVYGLVVERVLRPQVKESFPLVDSILNRNHIIEQTQTLYPKAEIEFKSWLTARFLNTPQSSDPLRAGVRTAFLGSIGIILLTVVIAFPLGVGAAIYLQEYANTELPINRLIQTNINNLAGVPSIIYGILGLAVFVRALEPLTSGALLGFVESDTTASGRTILSAGATLALLILPVIIINAQEAIKAVPGSLREAAFGIGATRWQTVWSHVLPNALPGIMTGTILSISRAIGETAPLVVVGASTFITFDPTSPFSKFTALPIQIYQWTARPQPEFRNIAAAAILVLLTLLLSMNALAILIRNRFSRRDW